jgi:hypothetical protein
LTGIEWARRFSMIDMKTAAGMREATRLTQAGQLHEAVAIIQRTLQGEMGLKACGICSPPATKTTWTGRIRHPADENKGDPRTTPAALIIYYCFRAQGEKPAQNPRRRANGARPRA